MANKQLNSRIIHKHDTEANWNKASGFIPKQGEIIIYDKDFTYSYERFKIGDGLTVVTALPFADAHKANASHTHTKSQITDFPTSLPANGGNADTVDGKHAVDFATATGLSDLKDLVGDTSVSSQISSAVSTKANILDLTSHTGNTTVHITSTERTNWNAAKTHADSAHAPSNAEVNQNAFSNITVGSTTVAADSKTDTLTLAGSNVTLTPDVNNDKITIEITKTNVTDALGYTPPTTNTTYGAAGNSLGLVKSGGDVNISSGVITVNDDSHNHVISNVDGLQDALNTKGSASDVSNLKTLVGDTSVSSQITSAIASKSDVGHTHDNYASTVNTTGSGNAITAISQSGNTITATKGATFSTSDHTHNYIPTSEKGVNSGVATLDTNGKVPSSQLPSYVDDVIEGYYLSNKFYKTNSTSGTLITDEAGKIYVDLNTNKTYRWSGNAYVVISETLALGETSSTAYAGDKGKANAQAITALQTKVGDSTVVDQIDNAISNHTHTVSYTPAGSVSSTFKGTADTHYHLFNGIQTTSSTPSNSTLVNSIVDVGSLPSHTYTAPSLTASCSNQCLTLTFNAGSHSFSAGSLPTKGAAVSVATNEHTHTVSADGTIGQTTMTLGGTVTSTFIGTKTDFTTNVGQ